MLGFLLQGIAGVAVIAMLALYTASRARALGRKIGGRFIDLPKSERNALRKQYNGHLRAAHMAAISALTPLPAAFQTIIPDLLDRAGAVVSTAVLVSIIIAILKKAPLKSIVSIPPSPPSLATQSKAALIGLMAAVGLALALVCLVSPPLLRHLLAGAF